MFSALTLGTMLFATIALGQDLPLEMVEKTEPEMTGNWVAMFVLKWIIPAMIILRGLAEGLTRIAKYTDTKWDNKVAHWLSEAAWVLGVAVGKLGYSAPKLVIEEKAKQLNEKADAKGD